MAKVGGFYDGRFAVNATTVAAVIAAAGHADRAEPLQVEAIAQRLRQQILSGLHLGRLGPGQRLPSTRAVATELGVDQRRVARAYHELVIDGLVDLRPRSGCYVAANRNGSHSRLPAFASCAVDSLVELSEHGVRPIDVPERLRRCLASRTMSAACIECNDDQIHGLSVELESDYGFATQCVPLERIGEAGVRASLRASDLLVTTAFHASEVGRLARELAKPFIAITVRPDLLDRMRDAVQREDVFFVAADARFEAKAVALFADATSAHRVHALVVGRDDLSAIPAQAPTYIMRRARELLRDHPLAARVTAPPRVFSRESMRAILTFIVEASASS